MLNNKTKKQNRRNESSSPSNKKTKKGIKRSFTIAKMESNGNTIIPEYKILDGPAFAKVNFKLDKGDTIYANAGAMSYMDKSVAIKTETRGFLKGLVRGLFTSQSMFLTGYTGTKSNTQISFASHLSGDIMPMIIKPGEKYTLSSRSDCLLINPEDYHTMYNFSKDAVLMVLASENYDPKDYIYEQY